LTQAGTALMTKRGAAAALAAVALLVVLFWLNSRAFGWVLSLVGFFQTRSLQAIAIYVLIYIAVCLSCLPLTPLEVLTGFCFGVPNGIFIDITGRVLGSVMSFLIARFVLAKMGSNCFCVTDLKGAAVLRGVGKAVEEKGLRFLVLFNLAYVPVAVKNYGLGFVSEVPLHKFVAAIFIVEVPMASIWACIGSAAAADFEAAGGSSSNSTAASDAIHNGIKHEHAWLKWVLVVGGIGSVFFVMHAIHRSVAGELAKLHLHADADEERNDGLGELLPETEQAA